MKAEPIFRYRFPQPGQPNQVLFWPADEPKHPRAVELESGFEAVHIRWPLAIIDDHECDEPDKVARTLTEALSGYVQTRRTADEYAVFEIAVLDWIMERRGQASIADHEAG